MQVPRRSGRANKGIPAQRLDFSGIPEQQNENTDKIVTEDAKAAGVNKGE